MNRSLQLRTANPSSQFKSLETSIDLKMIQLLFFVFCLTLTTDEPQDVWPAFLGQGHHAVSPEVVPTHWSPSEHIAWKTQLAGKGQSSPVVWGDVAFVTSIEGSMKEKCHVQALSITSGKLLWTRTINAAQTVRSNYFQSRSAPTPVVDSERIVAFFETGNLLALNHQGEVIWERALTDEYGPFESTIGLAASPIQTRNAVILLADHEGESYLLSVDKKSGETNWKTARESRVSYASPSLMSIQGKQQIVCSSAGTVEGFDPESGELLWSLSELGGNSQNTPLPFGDGFLLIGASPGMHDEREAAARESNLCMQVLKSAEGFETKVIWKNHKALTTFASPIAYKGHAYWVTKAGVLYCFDLATGEEKYKQRLPQQCWATPHGIGDRIYFFGKDGATAVIQAGAEYKLLAENNLWDPASVPATSPGSRGGRSTHEHKEDEADTADRRSSQDTKNGDRSPKPAGPEVSTANASSDKRSAGPPQSEAEREAARSQGENRFADPVQYGYAVTNNGILIRTGEVLYCVR